MKKRDGISIIVLVIMIITLIILAGTAVAITINNNSIKKASESKFKSVLRSYNEELTLYITNNAKRDKNYDSSTLNADKNIGSEIVGGDTISLSGIQKIITSMNNSDAEMFIIKKR